jgi:ParB-like chromosome segregation protein Spo0J
MTKAEKVADDVARLAGAGIGRNEIAGRLGVSTATVTRAARLRGVEFDRAQTVAATEAVIRDAKASRASLALRMVAAAHDALDSFHQARIANEAGEARHWMTAAAVATDKHLALDLHDRSDGRSLSAFDEFARVMLGRNVAAVDGGKISPDELDGVTHIDQL